MPKSTLAELVESWMIYSLMKCWLSSLDRKTLEPLVRLLISAISWPQSPSCIASTLKAINTNASQQPSKSAMNTTGLNFTSWSEERKKKSLIKAQFRISYRSARSPLSRLAPEWLPEPPDLLLLPTEVWVTGTFSWEELWEELLLSVSSQPPPACPGHLWDAVRRRDIRALNSLTCIPDWRLCPAHLYGCGMGCCRHTLARPSPR